MKADRMVYSPNVGLMLSQRRRSWTSFESALFWAMLRFVNMSIPFKGIDWFVCVHVVGLRSHQTIFS